MLGVDFRHVLPLVKWTGGTGQLLSTLDSLIPSKFSRYFELLLGGGTMFFHLASKNMISTASLSGTNQDLIKAYIVVRDSVDELIQVLNETHPSTTIY